MYTSINVLIKLKQNAMHVRIWHLETYSMLSSFYEAILQGIHSINFRFIWFYKLM